MMVPANPLTRNLALKSAIDLTPSGTSRPLSALSRSECRCHIPSTVVQHVGAAAPLQPGNMLARVQPERQRCTEGESGFAPVVVDAVLPISTVPLETASSTCRPGTISPAANG
jgi:hypothetical protein